MPATAAARRLRQAGLMNGGAVAAGPESLMVIASNLAGTERSPRPAGWSAAQGSGRYGPPEELPPRCSRRAQRTPAWPTSLSWNRSAAVAPVAPAIDAAAFHLRYPSGAPFVPRCRASRARPEALLPHLGRVSLLA